MGNSSKNQPTVAIEKWLTEGRKIHKRHQFTFFFASFMGTIICTPLSIVFVGFVGSRLWEYRYHGSVSSGSFFLAGILVDSRAGGNHQCTAVVGFIRTTVCRIVLYGTEVDARREAPHP